MVSGISIVFMFVTFILSVGFPVGLVIYFYRKWKISLFAVLTGALMFFLFQFVTRIPVLTIIQMQDWYKAFAGQNMVLTGVIIAFTAALFETAGRYLGLKYILKNKLDRKNSIAYGIGHGGIESIILVGITYIANIVYSILINAGVVDSKLVPQLVDLAPGIFLAAGIERVFAILFHIAAALLVAYGIMYNKYMYILLSLLFHTLLDAIVVILQIYNTPIWGIELFVAVVGFMSLVFIMKSNSMFIPESTFISPSKEAVNEAVKEENGGGSTVAETGSLPGDDKGVDIDADKNGGKINNHGGGGNGGI